MLAIVSSFKEASDLDSDIALLASHMPKQKANHRYAG